jgi:putative ABC transport system permease protein
MMRACSWALVLLTDMEKLWHDLRHGARLLTKSPAVSAVAILAIGLGIGLTTAMFSIVYGTVLRGLPYEGSERFMYVGQHNLPAGQEFVGISIHDYNDYRAEQRAFEDLAAYHQTGLSLSGTERAEYIEGVHLTSNTFQILGVQPQLGRLFTSADERAGAERVALISETLWRNRYASDPAILGKPIRLNGRQATIIGVMPAEFRFPDRQQIWLPMDLDPVALARGTGQTLDVFGRLRPGTSREDAVAQLTAIAERMERDNPTTNKDVRPTVDPFMQVYVGRDAVQLLNTMLGAVFLVLLIACTNVANLLLSRAILRAKEVGIRAALGASRARLAFQFLSESVVLCAAGAVLGTLLSYVGIWAFNASLEPSRIPAFIDIRMDAAVLQFVLGLTLLTALVSGVIPAIKASRGDVNHVLKDESRGASSFRLGKLSRGLVMFEIALSCGLLVAAGLTTRSIVQLRNVDLGFDDARMFTALLTLPQAMYPDSALPRFYDRLHEQLGQVGDFEAFTLASSLPGWGGMDERIALEGRSYDRPQDHPTAMRIGITPTYAATLGVQLSEGRNFTDADRAGATLVALVNRGFARKYFPGESVIGRRLRIANEENAQSWLTIVGVLPDLRYEELADPDVETAVFFVPLAQRPQSTFFIMGRTRADPLAVTNDVRSAVAAIDGDLPLRWPRTLRSAIELDTWFINVFGSLFIMFGAVALGLAAVGLYAVMAFSVSQRTREVGIRMALGADAGQVLRMILRQGVVQVTIGMAFGLFLAVWVSRLLAVILFDVNARDPVIFAGVVTVLTLTALLACIVPAHRATRIHPLQALRHD